jgi:hypothetical protein
MKLLNRLGLLLVVGGLLVVLYVTAFACRFDVFSFPVRNDTHGWLGPAMRGDSRIVDIGKIYFYEGTDFFSYRLFHPLCKGWLWVHGF